VGKGPLAENEKGGGGGGAGGLLLSALAGAAAAWTLGVLRGESAEGRRRSLRRADGAPPEATGTPQAEVEEAKQRARERLEHEEVRWTSANAAAKRLGPEEVAEEEPQQTGAQLRRAAEEARAEGGIGLEAEVAARRLVAKALAADRRELLREQEVVERALRRVNLELDQAETDLWEAQCLLAEQADKAVGAGDEDTPAEAQESNETGPGDASPERQPSPATTAPAVVTPPSYIS